MNKKYYVLLGVILVVIAIVIGTSYAYFMANVTGGDSGNETVIKSGSLNLTLADTNTITLNNSKPGDSASKEFTVTNTSNSSMIYNIKLVDVTNTFVDKNDLVYSIIGDNGVNITDNVVPSVSDEYLVTNISIDGGATHTYTLTITFKETNDNQNDNMRVGFSGRINIDVENLLYLDNSGANAPELLDNMIPIVYDGSKWVYTTTEQVKWYNYNDKQWANAVVLNDGVEKTIGDTISEEDIALWYVWIPRYTYTIFNGNNETINPVEIHISFEKGINSSGTVECHDVDLALNPSSEVSEVCTDTTNGSIINGTSTYTHPAFTLGDTKLTGFWVGKFEASGTTAKIEIKPNVSSLRNQKMSAFFSAIQNMSDQYNLNGDSHMMKNMEWGAVAYLSHSKYGTCTDGSCQEIGINNNSNYITGCGAIAGSTATDSCNVYSSPNGMLASTTKNIFGVYDMSGGAWESTMGSIVNSNGEFFDSEAGFVDTSIPDSKYFESYAYDTITTTFKRGKLGDATREIVSVLDVLVGGWYNDSSYLPTNNSSWFIRSQHYDSGAYAGIFTFGRTGGAVQPFISTRAVLTVNN